MPASLMPRVERYSGPRGRGVGGGKVRLRTGINQNGGTTAVWLFGRSSVSVLKDKGTGIRTRDQ